MSSKLTAIGRLLHGRHANDPISLPISREKYDDPTFIPRFSFRPSPRGPTDLDQMTRALRLHRDYAFFIDTNLVNMAGEWWHALLAEPGRVYVTGRVLRELLPILQRKSEHPLRQALRDKNPAVVLCADPDERSANRVFRYYIFLLAARRLQYGGCGKAFCDQPGRQPTRQEMIELKMRFQGWAGKRALGISSKPISPLRTDEALVVLAVTHSVRTGQPTKIVSADLDVEEQFYAMVRL